MIRIRKGIMNYQQSCSDYLINGVHFLVNDGWCDDVVDICHSLQHALTVPLGLVLVTELKGFMDTYELNDIALNKSLT